MPTSINVQLNLSLRAFTLLKQFTNGYISKGKALSLNFVCLGFAANL